MQNLRVSEIIEFSGGINTVVAPYLIAPNEATHLANSDVRRGALWSRRSPLFKQDMGYPYFYEFQGTVYQFPVNRYSTEFDRKWYWANGFQTRKVLPDGTELPLGLDAPTRMLSAVAEDAGPHHGDYKYTYTYYDNDHGVESAPAPLTRYINANENNIRLYDFEPPVEPSVTHYRLYRIGGYYPFFALVAEIPVTDVEYTDKLDDTQIDGRELQTLRNGKPPFGLKFLTEYNGRMYGGVGNKLYFSALGNPDSWYIFDWIPMQDTITGIAKAPGGLLVMGKTWTAALKGNQPTDFRLKNLSNVIGCKNHFSISYIEGNAIWISDRGLVSSNGYNVELLTRDKVEEVSGLLPTGACSVNDVYYMSFRPELYPKYTLFPGDDLYPAGTSGVSGVDQGILIMDFKRGRGYSYQVLDIPNITMVGLLDGNVGLIHGLANEAGFPVCDNDGFPNCFHTLSCSGYELAYLDKHKEYQVTWFSPLHDLYPHNFLYPMDVIGFGWEFINNSLPLSYISPMFVENSPTTLKEYDKVRITFRGVFNVQVVFDNDRVVVDTMIASLNEKHNDFAIIGIPNADDKSYSIKFIISGLGVIRGIQWTWQSRSLP